MSHVSHACVSRPCTALTIGKRGATALSGRKGPLTELTILDCRTIGPDQDDPANNDESINSAHVAEDLFIPHLFGMPLPDSIRHTRLLGIFELTMQRPFQRSPTDGPCSSCKLPRR